MKKFKDRVEAGKLLANALHAYAERDDVLVLALPRGGVPVAFEIAKKLKAPLDVFIVRKIGVPWHSELAMGAISAGGAIIFNEDIVRQLNISQQAIQAVIEKEEKELQRRENVYRGNTAFPSLENKIVILVDDGIATGATIRVAIAALRKLKVGKLIVAVPVAAADTYEQLAPLADDFICLLTPINFYAVGAWYENFSQTEDEEVHTLLSQAKAFAIKR